MQFTLGVLSTLCLVLITILMVVMIKLNEKLEKIYRDLSQVTGGIAEVNQTIANLPPPVLVHLGLKDGPVTTGLIPATLTIRPEQFQVNADKLYKELCRQMELRKDDELSIRAYVILNRSGFDALVDNKSRREADDALTRLFINEDTKGVADFLRILADSVCHVSVDPITAAS